MCYWFVCPDPVWKPVIKFQHLPRDARKLRPHVPAVPLARANITQYNRV